MRTTILAAALAAASVLGCTRSAPPVDPASNDVFDAIKARDAARLGAILDARPVLASARRPDGTSAILVAMFAINPDGETFARPDENAMLRAIAAHHPVLDVFDAAALGDVDRLTELVAADPALAAASHAAFGTTPLHLAAFAGRTAAIEYLIAKGAPVNAIAKNSFRNTPLVVSTLTLQREAAALLLAKGADPNVPEEGGYRALHIAAAANDVAMIALLLDHGAVLDAKADDGSTPLEMARKKQRAEAAAALAARGR